MVVLVVFLEFSSGIFTITIQSSVKFVIALFFSSLERQYNLLNAQQ